MPRFQVASGHAAKSMQLLQAMLNAQVGHFVLPYRRVVVRSSPPLGVSAHAGTWERRLWRIGARCLLVAGILLHRSCFNTGVNVYLPQILTAWR